METPFYLQGKGKNLITPVMIKEFSNENPELLSYLTSHNVELRRIPFSHFESFCAWVISQQISGSVAELLIQRFRAVLTQITPQQVLKTEDKEFKEIGLSISKIRTITNLAIFFSDQTNPIQHRELSSNEIIEHYTQVKGIGPWTVNMFLIFNLGRMDVKAPKDLVIRKGMQILYNLDEIPSISKANEIMSTWGNLSTIGCILSWAVMGE